MDIKLSPYQSLALQSSSSPLRGATGIPSQNLLFQQEGKQEQSASANASLQPLKVTTRSNSISGFTPLMTGLRDWIEEGSLPAVASQPVKSSPYPQKPLTYSGGFSLEVKTREGDRIQIRFEEIHDDHVRGDRSLRASYEIQGELSKEERQALEKVVDKMLEISDRFFSSTVGFGHLAIMDNLQFFDAEQLASFALNISQSREFSGRAQKLNSSLSYGYEVDLNGGSQRLRSELVLWYRQNEYGGRQKFGYDVTSAINPTAGQLLEGLDVRGLGRPQLNQSAPTALPRYYQGALQALASNLDQLASLAKDSSAQQLPLPGEDLVTQLFQQMAPQHPAFKEAPEAVQQRLSKLFKILPVLLKYSNQLNTLSFRGSLKVKA